MAKATQSEDTAARFKAYGFDVQEVNGQDMQAISRCAQHREGKQ